MASSIEFVSMTQWIMLAKARELICWIQRSSFLYCDATTCFMEGILSTERSLFLQKGCVCIYRKVCNQILKCPCTVCNAGSDACSHNDCFVYNLWSYFILLHQMHSRVISLCDSVLMYFFFFYCARYKIPG